jgi:hypothetical protein
LACEEAELGPEAFARKMEDVKKFQQQVSIQNYRTGFLAFDLLQIASFDIRSPRQFAPVMMMFEHVSCVQQMGMLQQLRSFPVDQQQAVSQSVSILHIDPAFTCASLHDQYGPLYF